MPQFAVFSPTGTESNIDINPYSQDTVIEIRYSQLLLGQTLQFLGLHSTQLKS